MKRLLPILFIILTTCASPSVHPPSLPPAPSVLSVLFSPKGGCTDAIVNELDKAKESILMQAYSFTSAPIAKSLVAAHERGVKVEIILDKSNLTAQYTSGPFVAKAGIPTRIDSVHEIAHNKIIIIDGETVITGSFNFTKAAEDKNAENLLVIKDKTVAAKYVENWEAHWEHSEVYDRGGTSVSYSKSMRSSAEPMGKGLEGAELSGLRWRFWRRSWCGEVGKGGDYKSTMDSLKMI